MFRPCSWSPLAQIVVVLLVCKTSGLQVGSVDSDKGVAQLDSNRSTRSSSMLVVLNGYPGGHELLMAQGERVLKQNGGLMLTSHEEAVLSHRDGEAVKAHAIKPSTFCSKPAVGEHKRNCNRADADNKFLGAAFLANASRHGFKWLLLGDDDTTFFLDGMEQELAKHDPNDTHYFGIQIGRRGSQEKRPKGYELALRRCPPLGDKRSLRFWSLNTTHDITDVKKDCDPKPFRDDSWFSWAKGGNGIVLSAGLLDSIPASDWQQCVDRILTFGGDVRIALCLALLGHRVERLGELEGLKLSAHKLDLGLVQHSKSQDGKAHRSKERRQIEERHLKGKRRHADATRLAGRSHRASESLSENHSRAEHRGDMVQRLKKDKLFSLASLHEGAARSVSEGCSSWQGEGLSCEIEYPEHELVRSWIPPDAVVMEFGARFGTTSCEIARKLNNSGDLVVVEPDLNVWGDLEANLRSHSCNARMLRGGLSSTDLHVPGKPNVKHGYANRPVDKGGKVVPGYRLHEVEAALGKKVDTLLIDCEGCAQSMMDQIGPPIKSGQIKLIVIEGDMPVGAKDCKSHCMDYKNFFGFLEESGFEMVDKFNDCDRDRTGASKSQWCGNWIDHFAWRRKDVAPKLRVASAAATFLARSAVVSGAKRVGSGAKVAVKARLGATIVQRLKEDKLFSGARRFKGAAKTVSEDCSSWQGEGISCGVEHAQHSLVRKWVQQSATVMELGARFGTTSCEIASKLNNSGNLLVVEPDLNVWKYLEANLNTHQCNAHILRGAVGATDLHMAANPPKDSGYVSRPLHSEDAALFGAHHDVPGFRFDEVEAALGKKVDTVLVDCEGCLQDVMDELESPIKSGQISMMLIEADMAVGAKDCSHHCVDYKDVFSFLERSGFEQVDKINDCSRAGASTAAGAGSCRSWVNHYAFRLKAERVRDTFAVVKQLREDALFAPAKLHAAGFAETVSDNCDSWQGEGLDCEIEYPEHALVRSWIPPEATVMEFGARFGTTSCEIARKLNNSGRLVVVEPDLNVWDALEANLAEHKCNARMLRGAVSSTDLHMAAQLNVKRGYANRPLKDGGKVVPGFRFEEVERAMKRQVDTLLIDCEGCAQFMMDQLAPPIRKGQIKLIIIEGDMPVGAKDCHSRCMDYEKFFHFLYENGFEKVDEFNDCDRERTGAPGGQWCGKWINHYAFRLM